MKHIIFDFDGVLIDSFDFHLNKYNELYDINLTAEELRSVHDGNFYDNKLEKFKDIKFDEYAKKVAEDEGKLPLNDTLKEIIVEHAKRGKNHLITSGWCVQVLPFLENHDIKQYFSMIMFREDGLTKHEKFRRLLSEQKAAPKECLFVTDTLGDLLEVQALGIPTLAVTFGFHSKERLLKGDPTYIFDSWEDAAKVTQSIPN